MHRGRGGMMGLFAQSGGKERRAGIVVLETSLVRPRDEILQREDREMGYLLPSLVATLSTMCRPPPIRLPTFTWVS